MIYAVRVPPSASSTSQSIQRVRSPSRSMILVTHYQRLLDYITPDFVHVLSDGRIVKSGGKELALELEASGYMGLEAETANAR